jgi:hypothetical protein
VYSEDITIKAIMLLLSNLQFFSSHLMFGRSD